MQPFEVYVKSRSYCKFGRRGDVRALTFVIVYDVTATRYFFPELFLGKSERLTEFLYSNVTIHVVTSFNIYILSYPYGFVNP